VNEEYNELDLNKIGEVDSVEVDCIIVDKVYASCSQRHCIPKVEVSIASGKTFKEIRFKPGFIVPGTLAITDIENRPQFRRVMFTLRIPYDIIYTDGTSEEKFLPDILKDIVLFIPDARDEFTFEIVIETSSRTLGMPIVTNGKVSFAVGIFVIVKVVGRVQLLIPTFGFCPEPIECEDFSPKDVCENFEYEPFPDFFPPQYEDVFDD